MSVDARKYAIWRREVYGTYPSFLLTADCLAAIFWRLLALLQLHERVKWGFPKIGDPNTVP